MPKTIFPLAFPLFDVGTVTITKNAEALLKKNGLTSAEVVDRVQRVDWPAENDERFGEEMAALKDGNEVYITFRFGAPLTAAEMHVSVECAPGRSTTIETGREHIHRIDPEHFGPRGELPKKTWGKGTYTAPPVEVVSR